MLSIYRLPGALPDEKIIKFIRKDFFVLFRKILAFVFLLVLPIIFYYVILVVIAPHILDNEFFYPVFVLSMSAYYLFIWLFFFFMFIDYYLDIWIITDKRIISIEQKGFFARTITEQKLFRIQDVTSEVHGAFQTIFNFGDVYVQTAGTVNRTILKRVPDPDGIRNTIVSLVERDKARHGVKENII